MCNSRHTIEIHIHTLAYFSANNTVTEHSRTIQTNILTHLFKQNNKYQCSEFERLLNLIEIENPLDLLHLHIFV